jgi:hypothetical protein
MFLCDKQTLIARERFFAPQKDAIIPPEPYIFTAGVI